MMRRYRNRRRGGTLPELTTLDLLPVDARGVVHSINGDRRMRRRLMEMGLLEGSVLRVVKFAPSGNPIEIKINDYFLSLRKEEAATVVVKPSLSEN